VPVPDVTADSPIAAPDDHQVAAQLATEAGELLVELRHDLSRSGITGRPLGDEGDAAAHQLLIRRLAELRPDDAVLSEEGADDPVRLTAPRVWIVDPLDGTWEYGEVPRSDWAVHVALVAGGRPIAGAVALPAQQMTLATEPAPVLPPAKERPPQIVASQSRRPPQAGWVAEALGGELVALGSAGAKAMAVVLGDVDIYLHAGGQYEWDSCAPVAVAQAAGLHCSRLDGSPLVYNRPDPYLPDLLICRPEYAQPAITAAAAPAP
jgi:3'(2'), 5'-bisphosphate nucleotidase